MEKQTAELSFAERDFDVWVFFSETSLSCFVVSIYPVERAASGIYFFILFVFFILLMSWPHLLMNVGTEARIQLLSRTNRTFKKVLSLYCLLMYFKKMNVK